LPGTTGVGHAGTTGTTLAGTTGIGHSDTRNTGYGAGPHSSDIANKLDPRVDSDLDGRGQRHVAGETNATAGSSSAQNTAGPHSSDLLNKLDPRQVASTSDDESP